MVRRRKRPAWQRNLLKIVGNRKLLVEKLATAAVVLLVTGVLASAAIKSPTASAPIPQPAPQEPVATPEAPTPTTLPPSTPTATPSAAAPSCATTSAMYVNTIRGLNLRSERSLNATVITKMPHGSAVRAGCRQGDWFTVTYNFQTGYALAQYLVSTPPKTGGTTTTPSFKVTEVSVSVNPTGTQVGCQQEYIFTGTLKSDGAGTVNYRWERTDGSSAIGSVVFSAAGTKTVTNSWLVTTSIEGSAHLRVLSPNVLVSNDSAVSFIDSAVCL